MCLNAHCRAQTLRLALAHEVEVRAEQSLSISDVALVGGVWVVSSKTQSMIRFIKIVARFEENM